MQFVAISLEGVAAILSIFVAAEAFMLYRLQQRSEAAAKALIVVNNFVNYIKQIGAKQGMYEYLDYYPDRIPEIAFDNKSFGMATARCFKRMPCQFELSYFP